jgi:hypothetical protein
MTIFLLGIVAGSLFGCFWCMYRRGEKHYQDKLKIEMENIKNRGLRYVDDRLYCNHCESCLGVVEPEEDHVKCL